METEANSDVAATLALPVPFSGKYCDSGNCLSLTVEENEECFLLDN
jgi:hypothetical protein